MREVAAVGLDLAKNVFQGRSIETMGVVVAPKLKVRRQFTHVLEALSP